jgi:hypothetical protein
VACADLVTFYAAKVARSQTLARNGRLGGERTNALKSQQAASANAAAPPQQMPDEHLPAAFDGAEDSADAADTSPKPSRPHPPRLALADGA